MAIEVDIDIMRARRNMSVGMLAELAGITPANLAVLKNGRAKAVRFSTLESLCRALDCQPGDLLRWVPDAEAHPDAQSGAEQDGSGDTVRTLNTPLLGDTGDSTASHS